MTIEELKEYEWAIRSGLESAKYVKGFVGHVDKVKRGLTAAVLLLDHQIKVSLEQQFSEAHEHAGPK